MMKFHVSWHRAPAVVSPAAEWTGLVTPLPTVRLAGADLYAAWEISFEAAIAAMEALPGMYCEWDGAWAWHPARDRQAEGVLYDRGGRLAYVEMKGDCAGDEIDVLARALNPTAHPIVVQLPREGIVLHWADWRAAQFASCAG